MRFVFLNVVILLFSFSNVCAQDTITEYYNIDWVEISDKNQASYYRKAFLDSNKIWTVNDYFISNKIQMTGTFKTKKLNVKQGHFIYFFENGRKLSEGKYLNDKEDSFWTYWHENGQIESVGKYVNGLRQEKWTYWHENGQKQSEGLYVDNKAEDKWNYWFDTGEKKSEGLYLHGKKDGTWRYYYKTGNIESVEKYTNGNLNSISSYFDNGSCMYEGNCINGQSEGEWKYWNIDGRVFLKGKFSNNLQVGEWIRYFPNGEYMKIYFENGILVSRQLGGIVKNK